MTVLGSLFKKSKASLEATAAGDGNGKGKGKQVTVEETDHSASGSEAPTNKERVQVPSELLERAHLDDEESIFVDAIETIEEAQVKQAVAVDTYQMYRKQGLPAAMILKKWHTKQEYNYAALMDGKKVPELWQENADTLIFLGVKDSARPPSFLVDSHTLLSKSEFFVVAFSPNWQGSHTIDSVTYPTARYSLYFTPDKREDASPIERLRHYITIRNIFACIFDGFCVGLEGDEGATMLGDMSERMMMYFEGADSGVGQQLGRFVTDSGLYDVRGDASKALDLLVLSSTYHIENLYLEAFVHCVGMFPEVRDLGAEDQLEEQYFAKLQDAHKEVASQLSSAMAPLEKFYFKELWSTKSPTISAPMSWRKSYEEMRKFLYMYYKHHFGHWLPKDVSSRKVIMTLQADFAALWDLMVDRTVKTQEASRAYPVLETYMKTLKHIDGQQASLPYGVPRFPGPSAARFSNDLPDFDNYKFSSKHKLTLAQAKMELELSYNAHPSAQTRGIVNAFKDFEARTGAGKNVLRLCDNRGGMWLLVYAVLSTLARVSVEDGVTFKDGVDYMLCCDLHGVVCWNEEAEGSDMSKREICKDSYCWRQPESRWTLVQTENGVQETTASLDPDAIGEAI